MLPQRQSVVGEETQETHATIKGDHNRPAYTARYKDTFNSRRSSQNSHKTETRTVPHVATNTTEAAIEI